MKYRYSYLDNDRMEIHGEQVSAEQQSISQLQLKQLLNDIMEHAPHVNIKYRLEGEPWQDWFGKVTLANEHRIFLLEEAKDRLISVPLMPMIEIQFDHDFRCYSAHTPYEVLTA